MLAQLYKQATHKSFVLTIQERTVLEFAEQGVITALVTGALAIGGLLTQHRSIDWLSIVSVSLLVGILSALSKYFGARGDSTVTQVLQKAEQGVLAELNKPPS